MHTSPNDTGEALDILRKYWSGPMGVYPECGYFKMPDWQFVDMNSPVYKILKSGDKPSNTMVDQAASMGPQAKVVRLADPEQGRVLVGGVDVRDADTNALRRDVSIVFQESFLFATTVRENIALDAAVAEADVVRAAMIASADRFIRELPQGYDTVVGERGYTLSGGQRQRVALARALVRAPRVLILDDATSSVDPTVEADILAALRRELSTTLVVVAYRLSTIRLADRVIFLEDGVVKATGPHEELLAREPGYAAIIHAYERGERGEG
jgi:ABC-type multidrug transport system fused ATPase/permease subunit